jgi:hypothetical protein
MSASVTFKRGGTFSFGCTVLLPAGTWSAACQLRDGRGNLIQTVTVTLTPPVNPAIEHSLLLVVPAADTASWPVGQALYGDVEFTDASATPIVLPSGTFTVNVIEKLTA